MTNAELLERALIRSGHGDRLEAVERRLVNGTAHMWPGTASVAVAEPVRSYNVWLFGGQLSEVPAMLASGEAWARSNGLDEMTITDARPGWERALAPLGYAPRRVLTKGL